MENKPNRIIWHHSADDYTGDQFRKINDYHQSLDFPQSSLGYFVGYHYLVEKSGEVKKARNEDEIGAHDRGENVNSLGICFAGDFSVELPNERQEEAAARLIGEIMKRWSIPITRIEPHRWGDTTECPGKRLNDFWLALTYIKWEANWLERLIYQYILKKI